MRSKNLQICVTSFTNAPFTNAQFHEICKIVLLIEAFCMRVNKSTDATGPHHQENPSNKPDLLMLVLWSTSG